MTGSPHFLVGGMELDGRLLSVAMAERCGDTLQIHIEKALYGYEGVYPATVQAFAQEFAVDGVRWLNREDDAGDKGLRTSSTCPTTSARSCASTCSTSWSTSPRSPRLPPPA